MNVRVPPRGLRWTDAPLGRLLAFVLAVTSLVMSFMIGSRYVALIDCLQDRDVADQRRSAAIAGATDAERSADLALIVGPPSAELRAAAVAARKRTDAVRAAYPPLPAVPCK